MKLSRRQFLKAAGLTGLTAVVSGCSDANRTLIPYVATPEDLVPGEATWYATTCRECPAGCGMVAKNMDGRAIKVEGNPLSPINSGKLCARGQASLQGVYNPDRYREPVKRPTRESLAPLSWDEAEKTVLDALASVSEGRRGERVLFISDLTTGSEEEMIKRFLAGLGSSNHIMYEPFAYEPLKQATKEVFGYNVVPSYRIDKADFLLSFGADFLETWISNVRFAHQFSKYREPGERGKNPFYYVGPRLSMTGASADHWIPVQPDRQSIFAFGLIHTLLERDYSPALDKDDAARLKALAAPFTPERVLNETGVRKEVMAGLADSFMKAKTPLVLAEGLGYQDSRALETARAANLLSGLVPRSGETIDFSRPHALSRTAKAGEMREWTEAMRGGKIDVLFILRANPVFHLPPEWGFLEALKKVGLTVFIGSFPDETGRRVQLVLPSHTFLESWGDYEPESGIRCLSQPVTGPLFDTRTPGDILLSLGRKLKGTGSFPEKDFYEALRRSWETTETKRSAPGERESAWQKSLEKGGSWGHDNGKKGIPAVRLSPANMKAPAQPQEGSGPEGLAFLAYPTVRFFDGRSANRPVLQEVPDPLTMITWDGWVEIHPETAKKASITTGDVLAIGAGEGKIEAPAYVWPGIRPGVLAMPLGYGHTAFGRYASGHTGNPVRILSGALDQAGCIMRPLSQVSALKTGRRVTLAHTDGSADQHDRHIARSLTYAEYVADAGREPDVIPPLEHGFSRERDFYPPHGHDAYRWGMAVDLDRCIGCGACVAACYMENNVAVVGREQVIKGRSMAWLQIQRYFEKQEPRVRFIPMMCQHCDEAPCESVCPVFAPNHSREGINNQVYNRCIGTRYCSQNCPYKVRRFNWFKWTHDKPLEWQLNPDVTVRTKGVMEKCSFCIQRINEARIRARSEDRLIGDGEFAPACAQTCPTDALVFGNLKDPASRVARITGQARAYQVLGELNTKPGVIYLKKITQRLV